MYFKTSSADFSQRAKRKLLEFEMWPFDMKNDVATAFFDIYDGESPFQPA